MTAITDEEADVDERVEFDDACSAKSLKELLADELADLYTSVVSVVLKFVNELADCEGVRLSLGEDSADAYAEVVVVNEAICNKSLCSMLLVFVMAVKTFESIFLFAFFYLKSLNIKFSLYLKS